MSISPSVESITHARATRVWFAADLLYVLLEDGRELGVPLMYFPRLDAATPEQQGHWEISGHGTGVYWPDIDEDLSVAGLLGAPKEYRPNTKLITSSPGEVKQVLDVSQLVAQLEIALQTTQLDKNNSTKSSVSRDSGRLPLPSIGTALSVLTGGSLLLYLLGLAILERHLEAAMGVSSEVAWQTASLVPQATTIVQALSTFLSFPSLRITIGTLIYTVLLVIGLVFVEKLMSTSPLNKRRALNALIAAVTFALALWLGFYSLSASTLSVNGLGASFFVVNILSLFSGLVISIGVFPDFWKSIKSRWLERIIAHVRRPFLCALALAYLGSLINAYYSYPPQKSVLRAIAITTTSNRVIKGELVSHSDGYWYVLDTSTKRERITPIRDSQTISIKWDE